MTDPQAAQPNRPVVPSALDRAVTSAPIPITLALRHVHLPPGLMLSTPERSALVLLRNLRDMDGGALEFLGSPTAVEAGPASIEEHGIEVADVLTEWAQDCRRPETRAVTRHLAFLIRKQAVRMNGQVAADARAAAEAYIEAATERARTGPEQSPVCGSALGFLAAVIPMLAAALRLDRQVNKSKRADEIATLVLDIASQYVKVEHVNEIGYVLSLVDVLEINRELVPRGKVLTLLQEAERLCTGLDTHKLTVQALLDQPGHTDEERRAIVCRWAEAMMKTAENEAPNQAFTQYMDIHEFCQAHSVNGGPIIEDLLRRIEAVGPALEFERVGLTVRVPKQLNVALANEMAVLRARLEATTSLAQAFRVIVDGPPPLPVERDPEGQPHEGLVLMPELKFGRGVSPIRWVPEKSIETERMNEHRVLTMVWCSQLPSAAISIIGQQFPVTPEQVVKTLPELSMVPENLPRFARALCDFWSGDYDRIDALEASASILIEGYAREVAHRLGIGTMRELPRMSGDTPNNGRFRDLGALLPRLRQHDAIDPAWIDSIDYFARHQGVGLNRRNDAAHALGIQRNRAFAALAIQAVLYFAAILGFRETRS